MRTRVLEHVAMVVALTSLAACTGGGINAGEKGGTAFILMALMLIALAAILYFILGREE